MENQNNLVVVENLELVPFFTKGDQVQSVLDRLKEEANSYVAGDLSVKKNRDAVKAMVTKFTKSKTYLESRGKELAAEYKAIPKAIDANRKLVKDTITELQEVVRKPLTEWENEQQRIADELAAEEAAKLLAKQKDADHELALLLDDKFNAELKEKAKIAEQQRIAYENQLKKQAAEEATRLANEAAEIEKQKAEAEKMRAIIERENAERREAQLKLDAENAEKQKIIDAENAEKRRIADIEAAKQAEIARQKAEADRLEVEQKARDTDKNHRASVNNAAMTALMELSGITEDQAKAVVIALVKGQIPNAKLAY